MGMTLEEAIKHAEEMANIYEDMTDDYVLDSQKLVKCANEHRQLAKWLRELAERRKQPEIIYCKDCIKQDLCAWCRDGAKYCGYAERRSKMQPNDYKEVDFETYCKTCRFKNAREDEDPCYECLKEPVSLHSVKPTKYIERTN